MYFTVIKKCKRNYLQFCKSIDVKVEELIRKCWMCSFTDERLCCAQWQGRHTDRARGCREFSACWVFHALVDSLEKPREKPFPCSLSSWENRLFGLGPRLPIYTNKFKSILLKTEPKWDHCDLTHPPISCYFRTAGVVFAPGLYFGEVASPSEGTFELLCLT